MHAALNYCPRLAHGQYIGLRSVILSENQWFLKFQVKNKNNDDEDEGDNGGSHSILQAKLTRLAIRIGYMGKQQLFVLVCLGLTCLAQQLATVRPVCNVVNTF